MIYSKNESVEEVIVRHLLKEGATAKALHKSLQSEQITISIQGMYKALRTLITNEIIIKHKLLYSLNKEWQKKVATEFRQSSGLLELAEGEVVRMDLTSLVHLDHQWKNIMIPLHETYPDYPMFIYNPHDVWKHLSKSRWESEQKYYDSFNTNKSQLYFILGGNTLHEYETKKLRQSRFINVSVVGRRHFKDTDHPVIFGDYIIKTRLPDRITQRIHEVFTTATTTGELNRRIALLGVEKKKVKLIITRNKHLAKSLRKKLASHFYIPQETINKYDLF